MDLVNSLTEADHVEEAHSADHLLAVVRDDDIYHVLFIGTREECRAYMNLADGVDLRRIQDGRLGRLVSWTMRHQHPLTGKL